jgi:hypothetical protein
MGVGCLLEAEGVAKVEVEVGGVEVALVGSVVSVTGNVDGVSSGNAVRSGREMELASLLAVAGS